MVSQFCDVALPVPLDRAFTYELGELEAEPGARVMVPFGGQRLVGIVVKVHGVAPAEEVEVKRVERVLDEAALLPEDLMELGRWIAGYYCAPLGEVLRGMVPLTAEVRRQWTYRIGEQGRKALHEAGTKGSSRRSKLSVEDQNREFAVLNYLESGDPAKTSALRSATGANKALLDAMAKKKWLVREPLQEVRDARRVEMIAVLEEVSAHTSSYGNRRIPKLNENQLAVMAELAGCGGKELVRELRVRLVRAGLPESTLGTLVKRGLVRLEESAQAFHVTSLASHGKKFAHEHALNEAQTEALATLVTAMEAGGFKPHLLYGITGSGKTAVYVAAMQRALAAGRSALLLVPEIGLTPGTAAQMVAAFGSEVALLHSQLTPDERAEQWHRIRRGEARVVVGTRSAVFAPMPNLGLIVVDEEHDGSYKQEETPRYHGRDVAVMRAKLISERSRLGCTVVLGSATPSLESWNNAERGRYARIEMLERVQQRPLPAVETLDMREEFRETGAEQLFSRRLIAETTATLERGEQVIILLNRRGYSFVVMCRQCGEKLECENCAISLTYHKGGDEQSLNGEARVGQRMECHYCGYRRGVPKTCPKCESEHLYYLGAGSQQGEERLAELFPGARIGRMDRDTVRTRGDMERLLSRLHSGEINLLVGTQMIAKGHDIHGVTLVGVVGADFALGLPDFRAAERVFQLLTQVSGRAGRGELPGKVLVQTYQPDHYVNQFARTHDYTGFAAREMYFRRAMRYPPFSVLANVIVQSERLEEVLDWATRIGRWVSDRKLEGVRVLGPAVAPNARLKRIYRYHLVLKSDRRDTLGAALREMLAFVDREQIPRRAVVIDVDPMHLM